MWGGGYQSEVTEISLAQLGGVGRRLSVRGNRDISGPARRCGEEATSQSSVPVRTEPVSNGLRFDSVRCLVRTYFEPFEHLIALYENKV